MDLKPQQLQTNKRFDLPKKGLPSIYRLPEMSITRHAVTFAGDEQTLIENTVWQPKPREELIRSCNIGFNLRIIYELCTMLNA